MAVAVAAAAAAAVATMVVLVVLVVLVDGARVRQRRRETRTHLLEGERRQGDRLLAFGPLLLRLDGVSGDRGGGQGWCVGDKTAASVGDVFWRSRLARADSAHVTNLSLLLEGCLVTATRPSLPAFRSLAPVLLPFAFAFFGHHRICGP